MQNTRVRQLLLLILNHLLTTDLRVPILWISGEGVSAHVQIVVQLYLFGRENEPPPECQGEERNRRFKGLSRSCPGLDETMVEVYPPLLHRQWFLSPYPWYLLICHPPPRPPSLAVSKAWPGWQSLWFTYLAKNRPGGTSSPVRGYPPLPLPPPPSRATVASPQIVIVVAIIIDTCLSLEEEDGSVNASIFGYERAKRIVIKVPQLCKIGYSDTKGFNK